MLGEAVGAMVEVGDSVGKIVGLTGLEEKNEEKA